MSTQPTRRALPGRGLFCRGCRYPLDGLVSPGVCPECGDAFDFEDRRTFALEAKPQKQWKEWTIIAFLAAVLVGITVAIRVALVYQPPGAGMLYIPVGAWLFYPLWQGAAALIVVLIGRVGGWLRDIPTAVMVGAAAGALTGIFDNVALVVLGIGLGSAAAFFIEWVWPR